ncbi:MAG: RNA-binding protein [Candidatus Binatia bacterium]
MGTRRQKDEDEVVGALHAVEQLIGGKLTTGSLRTSATDAVIKNPAAAAFGRLGASKGGKARAAALSDRKRKEIARKAAHARWGK